MDINNYSYAPTMLDDDYTFYYENDDMQITIDEERYYSKYVFWFYAFSWDGSLEIATKFINKDVALSVADFIKNNFAHTRPDDNNKLQQIIDNYSKSLLNVTYNFNDYYNMNA